MNTIAWLKAGLGTGLFLAWMLLEYYPPPAADIDKIKNWIQTALAALLGNSVSSIGGS